MEFFASLPREQPQERPAPPPTPEWVQPPKDEIPVAVAMVRRLARVPGAALSLRRFDVYRVGVEIDLRLDLWREPGLDPERWAQISELLHPRGRRPGREGQLRLGVTLADGTSARADGDPHWTLESLQERPPAPHLVVVGGGGSGDEDHWTSEVRAWLWPQPPAGPMTLHFLCEGVGIAEGSVDIDTTPFRAARDGVLDARSE